MTQTEWPADWSERMAGKGCPLCGVVGNGDNDHSIFLWTGNGTETRLQRHSSIPAYCIVLWAEGHVSEPDELPAQAAARYWHDVVETGRAIRSAFEPLKINYLTLGNAVPHLHTHVFPRLPGDPFPGRPFPWEVLTNVPATPDPVLQEQAAMLRASRAA